MNSFRNVMYFLDFENDDDFTPKSIPADKLTHLNYAFLDFDADGTLRWLNGDLVDPANPTNNALQEIRELKEINPDLKIGVSVGGWTKSGDFAPCAADHTSRANLVQNLINFVAFNDLDFVDVDWEYPGAVREPDPADEGDEGTLHATFADYENYVRLLSDIRAGLESLAQTTGKKYEVSIAVIAGLWEAADGQSGAPYIKRIFDCLDFANIMTYDMAGSWVPVTMHHTATFDNPSAPERAQRSVASSIKYYLENGAPPEKLDVGVAFYSRGWGGVENDGFDPLNLPGLYASNKGGPDDGRNGIWPYRMIPELIAKYGNDENGQPNLQWHFDDIAKAPYLYSAKDKVLYTLDNPVSIAAKCEYVKANNLGGIITWMQSQDAPTNEEDGIRDALTTEIYNSLLA